MNNFADWLNSEIEKRGWTFRETGRRAGLSGATISNVLAGKINPGLTFCRGIARAFKIQPEEVLRRAGLLPPRPAIEEDLEELLYFYDQLNRDDQMRLVDIARTLAEEQAKYHTRPATG